MPRSSIKAHFSLYGFDDPPEAVTKLLRVIPTETHLRGDYVGNTSRRWSSNAWMLGYPEEVGIGLEQSIARVQARLPSDLSALASLGSFPEAYFGCAIYLSYGVPDLRVGKATLARCSALGAAIDLDLYSLRGAPVVPEADRRSPSGWVPFELWKAVPPQGSMIEFSNGGEGDPEMPTATTLAAAFVVIGTGWNPVEVTHLLGLTPSATRQEGEGSEGAAWMLEVAEGAWSELDALVHEVLRPLPETLDALGALGGNWSAEVRVAIYERDGMPVGTIEAATIRQLAALQAGFDLRVSVMPAQRRPEPEDW